MPGRIEQHKDIFIPLSQKITVFHLPPWKMKNKTRGSTVVQISFFCAAQKKI
jgi:hypothetical protein